MPKYAPTRRASTSRCTGASAASTCSMILPTSPRRRGANRSPGARRPAGTAAARDGPIGIALRAVMIGAQPDAAGAVSRINAWMEAVGPDPAAPTAAELARSAVAARDIGEPAASPVAARSLGDDPARFAVAAPGVDEPARS